MIDKIFGNAGNEIVIEEYLQGKEISIHAFCDGTNAVLFPPSQDHKRIFENDRVQTPAEWEQLLRCLGLPKTT